MLMYAAFMMGLLGSMHCLGMCGPIAMALPVHTKNIWIKAMKYLLYNMGRVFTYAVLGFIAGIIGRGFVFAGLQQALSIAAGLLVILSVITLYYPMQNSWFSRVTLPFYRHVKSAFIHYFQHPNGFGLLALGLINGLLPCGMIYAALLAAIATGGAWQGTYFMIFFGLGTVPLMLAVSFAKNIMSFKMKHAFHKISPLVAVFIGLLLILRGLTIPIPHYIPFVSEKIHYKCQ
jgi:sulfite exporter TauE/SafE